MTKNIVRKTMATDLLIVGLLLSVLMIGSNIATVKATEPSGRLNGMVIDLTTMGSYTVSQVVSFMQTYHYNALKIYAGWGTSFWQSTWTYTGDPDDPIPAAAKTRIGDMITAATQQGWYVICTVSDQISPAKVNDTWHDAEVQVGYGGPNNDLNSQDNWLDYTGSYFLRYQKGLINTFVTMMNAAGCKPRIGIEEYQYVTGGSYPAFYATSMKNAYYAYSGSMPPSISTSTSYNSLTSTQKAFVKFINESMGNHIKTLFDYAYTLNNTVKFHVMNDNMAYYGVSSGTYYINYTLPFWVYLNSTIFESSETEAYGWVGSQNWAGLQTLFSLTKTWVPNTEYFFTYGYFSGSSGPENEDAVQLAMTNSFRGVWAYRFPSFYADPLDVSDDIPAITCSSQAYNTTAASTVCKFSSYWTDSVGLAGYFFSYDSGTGTYVNNSYVSLSGATASWANATKTLAASGTVHFKWYMNDTDGYWETTVAQTFVITESSVNTVVLGSPSTGSTTHVKAVTFTYTPTFYQAIVSASLWLNASGTWQSVASNASAVSNETINSISYTFTSEGTYVWNIKASNSTTAVSASANYTLYVLTNPYFGSISHSSEEIGEDCNFSAICYDGNELDYAILNTNVTGSPVNETRLELTGTSYIANWTLTLPSTYGADIQFIVYINDTDGNWGTSATYTFTLTGVVLNVTVNNPLATTYTVSTVNITITTSVVGGTIDKIMWNILNGSTPIFGSNQTYTVATSVSGFVSGNYHFWTWVNTTDGTTNDVSVEFYVSLPSSNYPAFRILAASGIIIEGVTFINCTIGIQLDGAGTENQFISNNMTGCTFPFVWNGTVEAIVRDNIGYNPVGMIAASVSVTGSFLVDAGSSGMQPGVNYTCTQSSKVVYISGYVAAIHINGIVVFSGDVNIALPLKVNDIIMVDWETEPTIHVMVQ